MKPYLTIGGFDNDVTYISKLPEQIGLNISVQVNGRFTQLWKEWEVHFLTPTRHLKLGGSEGGLIQSSITLLGVIYQPILKQKITRQTLEIDGLEEVQWNDFFISPTENNFQCMIKYGSIWDFVFSVTGDWQYFFNKMGIFIFCATEVMLMTYKLL